jgi:hypothetical protein
MGNVSSGPTRRDDIPRGGPRCVEGEQAAASYARDFGSDGGEETGHPHGQDSDGKSVGHPVPKRRETGTIAPCREAWSLAGTEWICSLDSHGKTKDVIPRRSVASP